MVSLRFEVPRLRGHHLLRVLDSTMHPFSIDPRYSWGEDPIFRIDVDPESVATVVAMVRERCPDARLVNGAADGPGLESLDEMYGEGRSPHAGRGADRAREPV